MELARSSSFRSEPSLYARSLLAPTLAHAAHHPFYVESWGPHAVSAAGLQADDWASALRILELAPALSKSQLAKDLRPVLDDGEYIGEVIHSSGTSGTFSFRYRSSNELADIRSLALSIAPKVGSPQRVCLSLASMFHGQEPARLSTPDTLWITISSAEDLFVKHAIELLRQPPSPSGDALPVKMLVGPILEVQVLTQCILDANLLPSEFGVSAIGVFGSRLGPLGRRALEAAWEAAIVETYSLSELSGGAVLCPRCGALTFDPQLVPTVSWIRPESDEDCGLGRLFLTELLPFGRCQPIIKYATGDLVSSVSASLACCTEHVGALRWVGREHASVLIEQPGLDAVCLGSGAIADALDDPGVTRGPTHVQLKSFITRDNIGSILAQVTVENPLDAPPEICVRFRTREGANDVGAVAVRVRERILRDVPTLASQIASKRVALTVIPDHQVTSKLSK